MDECKVPGTLAVVASKFWAYADVSYDVSRRAVGDYIIYPLFNKYGAVNLGDVRGGTRLFFAESLSGVINWSIAAPLFSINYVLLAALLERSLRPIKGLFSSTGLEGLLEQAVRVMRWGLWMAPVINTFLRQSADPTWFNQDGAVRSLVTIGADIGLSGADFRNFSLTMFLGLLAYDWLRVVIWFDHMGLRVATLVNLSFLGGDRADEAAGRYLGHGARTRPIPDGIRRFATWAPLLIPFYIPRGADWDKAWTGAETLRNTAGPMPGAIQVVAIAYVIAGAFGGLSGFLLANAAEFVSPAYMSWQRSGELVIMVLLGGTGTLYGAVMGAVVFVLAEEWLSGLTEHWKMIFGPLLVLIVLFARGGLIGLAGRFVRAKP